jgi:hypothetical protein
MLAFCHGLLEKEEAFVHPAMEARALGSSRRTAEEHVGHQRWLDDLDADLRAIERATGAARDAAADRVPQQRPVLRVARCGDDPDAALDASCISVV